MSTRARNIIMEDLILLINITILSNGMKIEISRTFCNNLLPITVNASNRARAEPDWFSQTLLLGQTVYLRPWVGRNPSPLQHSNNFQGREETVLFYSLLLEPTSWSEGKHQRPLLREAQSCHLLKLESILIPDMSAKAVSSTVFSSAGMNLIHLYGEK